MSIESLQKIIHLEEELLTAELAEQEKAEIWLKEQQDLIAKKHDEELSALEARIQEFNARAAEEARLKADKIVSESKQNAKKIQDIDDAMLRNHLVNNLQDLIRKGS